MVQTVKSLNAALDTLAMIEPAFAVALQRAGYPEPRVRDRGYATLLRTIMGHCHPQDHLLLRPTVV